MITATHDTRRQAVRGKTGRGGNDLGGCLKTMQMRGEHARGSLGGEKRWDSDLEDLLLGEQKEQEKRAIQDIASVFGLSSQKVGPAFKENGRVWERSSFGGGEIKSSVLNMLI